MFKYATQVCGCKLVRQGISNKSEWWNDKKRSTVLWKRKLFEQWLHQRSEEAFDVYRKERRIMNSNARKANRKVVDKFGMEVSHIFEGTRKMFWKEVKRVQ